MSTQYATVVAYYLVTYQQCFNLKLQQYFKLQYSTAHVVRVEALRLRDRYLHMLLES